MSNKRDYYEVLGIQQSATTAEIHKTFKRLALQYHPDRNVGDAEAEVRFKEVTEAYDILRDEEKRARYDRYGHAGLEGGFADGPGASFEDLVEGIFGSFFGRGNRSRSGARPGRDIQQVLDLTLEEAYVGIQKTITIHRNERCGACSGSGAKPGSKPRTCNRCNGQGVIIQRQGFFQLQRECNACSGRGFQITDPCHQCHGRGVEKVRRNLELKIPAGVDTGMRIPIRGEGEAGENGAQRGDLELVVRIAEHPYFQRDGDHLICQVPITFSQAALGAVIEIPTLTEPTKLTIPRGTQSHRLLRMPGLGMPNLRSGRRGDLVVQVMVDTPLQLTPRQEELLRELAEIEHANVSPARKSFLDRLKGYFSGESNAESA